MVRVPTPSDLLADEGWRYALLGGLVTVPFSAASYWQSGDTLSLTPVFFGGVLAGYLHARAGSGGDNLGRRVGLVGSLPVLWMAFDVLAWASAHSEGPDVWFVFVVPLLVIVFVVGAGIGLSVLAGVIGTRLGAWLEAQFHDDRPPAASG